nr:ABC transporter ATP-binding protein/permease [Lachnospiraceae bacterium]
MSKLTKIYEKMKDGTLKKMVEETIWIYAYAKRYLPQMILYTLLGMGGILISFGSSLVSKDLIDVITGQRVGELLKYFGLTIALSIFSLAFTQLTSFLNIMISQKVDNELRQEMFEKIMVTDWESITKYHSGDLLARWAGDTSLIASGLLNYIPNAFMAMLKFFGALYIVIRYDWTFAVFALLSAPITLFMSRFLMERMRNNNDRSAKMQARMNGFNQEAFVNMQTIKAFDLVPLYIQYLKGIQKDYLEMRIDFQKLTVKTSLLMSLVGMLVSYSCYGWGIYRVFSGVITYGTMTLFLSMSGNLTSALNTLISIVPQIISLTTSARRLMEIESMPNEDYSLRPEASEFLHKHADDGISLKLEDLSYTYRAGTEVFAHTSLEAHPHEIIALVGPSGEGKTTMLRILLALLRPQEGESYLYSENDDTIMEIAPYSRQMFAYVPQGNTMFSGTIAENLRKVKPEATDEELIEVLNMACAMEFVEKMPDGMN